MCHLHPSAWTFAKCWLARVRPSPSRWQLGTTSPSPWNPGGREPCLPQPRRRRNQRPQPWDEMQEGEKSFWEKNLLLLQRSLAMKFLEKKLKLLEKPQLCSIITRHPPHPWRGARWSLLGGRKRCPPSASWMVLLLLPRLLPGRTWHRAVNSAPWRSGRSADLWYLKWVHTPRFPVLFALPRQGTLVPVRRATVGSTTLEGDVKASQTWYADPANEQHHASQCINFNASCLVFFNARCFDIVQREQIILIKTTKKNADWC